jgi:hypothetical protein
MSVSTVTCAVKALVLATPISGPACVYEPAWVMRAMLLPTTLQMPMMVAPRPLAPVRSPPRCPPSRRFG